MRSGFIRIPAPMADPEPPEPTPFPIRIVADPLPPPPPPLPDSGAESSGLPSGRKRNDDFYPAWKKFLAQEPRRAKATSRAAAKVDEMKESVEQGAGGDDGGGGDGGSGLATRENAATSWEQAAAECRAKVAAIIDECRRLNQKYRDALFDLETNPYCLQSLSGRFPKAVDRIDAPPWIKRVEDIFENPQFFIDGATAYDVHQGSSGDCWFLAALMAVSAKKELIDRLCVVRDEKVGVYGFVFFRDGEWIYEVIDDKLFLKVGDDDNLQIVRDWDHEKKEGMQIYYDDEKLKSVLQKGGEALYFSHCKSNETWLPLIEKAYAKAHGDYYAIEGGFASEGIEDLTGGVGVVLNPEDIMDKERFWREQLSQVNEKYLFGGGSKPAASRGFVGGHAYAVLQAWEEGDLKLLKLRNPWGEVEWEGDWSDGSKLWTADMMMKLKHTFGDDGVFWISFKDFLKHFPCINRVRLFDESWSVAQQWTSVNVPWTVDYLDTKFQITVSEKGPVVILLCQPDDRYFYGLRGRYLFSMHFRVYKEGEDTRWIVRSMHNSGNETVFTRSVSAEIEDLEPGTYDVVFKITAVRQSSGSTAEEIIMKYALDRKDKLLSLGRRFDYAQSKGNLKSLERSNRKSKRQKVKDREKGSWKKARKINQEERERARRRKKRINDAVRDSRMEFNKKLRERQKRRREREVRSSDPAEPVSGTTETTDEADKPGDAAVTPPAEDEQKPDASSSTADGNAPSTEPAKAETDSSAAIDKPQDAEATDKVTKGISGLSLSQSNEKGDKTASPVSPLQKRDTDLSQGGARSHASRRSVVVDDYASGSDDDDEEPPLQPPIDDFDDDDFDWDSEMDGPLSSSLSSYSGSDDAGATADARSGNGSAQNRGAGSKGELFVDDPWNAMCVLGLRVYSKSTGTKIRVVKPEERRA